jgi:hypothetical protein
LYSGRAPSLGGTSVAGRQGDYYILPILEGSASIAHDCKRDIYSRFLHINLYTFFIDTYIHSHIHFNIYIYTTIHSYILVITLYHLHTFNRLLLHLIIVYPLLVYMLFIALCLHMRLLLALLLGFLVLFL